MLNQELIEFYARLERFERMKRRAQIAGIIVGGAFGLLLYSLIF